MGYYFFCCGECTADAGRKQWVRGGNAGQEVALEQFGET